MTLSITHPFVSPVADDADPNEVGPDEWNAGHTITMATARILGRSTAGAGAVEELAEAGFKTLFNLEIGTDTQAYDATLTSIAALGTAADKLAYTTGVDTWAETALTAFARSILDDASEAAFKATVNLEANTDFYAPAGTDVALADGGTGASLADPNADRIMAWDDTAGAVVFMAVADLVAEASPAAGDKYLAYTAEGALVGVDHANLPTGGISNVVEDVTPQLGGALDAQGFDITGGGVITLVEQAAAEADIAGRGQIWVETATPNVLKFTDDAGTDFSVVMAGSASHDGFSDFVANEHIDHSSVTLTAGAGLTGGGTIAANRSFAVTGVLEDINTLGANAADSEFLVGTGAGALAWESGATLRTSIGVDAAGTDNSTDVTFAGTGTYISLAGQVITVDPITESDISDLGSYYTLAGVLQDIDTLGVNAADSEFLVGTAAGAFAWESGATVRTSLGLAIGTDVLAQQTIGIADNNLVEVDGTPVNTEVAFWTASGLDSKSEAEFKSAFNLEAGTDFEAVDADILRADTADQLTAAFTEAVDDDGTKSSGTYTPSVSAGSNAKKIVNGGAFTLAAPSPATGEYICMSLLITNDGSAGTITIAASFNQTGDDLTIINGDDFLCRIEVYDIGGTEFASIDIKALQ